MLLSEPPTASAPPSRFSNMLSANRFITLGSKCVVALILTLGSMRTSILVGLTLGCFTTLNSCLFSSVFISITPSATLIMATRSSDLPQPSSIKASTEFPSAASFDRKSLMNLAISTPLNKYGEVSESKASNTPFCPILCCNLVVAMLMLFKSAQSAHIVSGRSGVSTPTVWLNASTKLSTSDSAPSTPFSIKSRMTPEGLCSVVTNITGLFSAILLITT